ncbi:DUF6348 family protein [Streptomyces sp. NPDC050564]|uniref:DUF6348 family protein n=1 Tax=Streptomyces sp. NPDC050564 TaxID=3365631 RepID=UPI00379BD807
MPRSSTRGRRRGSGGRHRRLLRGVRRPCRPHRRAGHRPPGQHLAPAVTAEGLARQQLMSIKLFFGTFNGKDTAEVRINGRRASLGGAAQRGLAAPQTGGSYARTYAVLAHTA